MKVVIFWGEMKREKMKGESEQTIIINAVVMEFLPSSHVIVCLRLQTHQQITKASRNSRPYNPESYAVIFSNYA